MPNKPNNYRLAYGEVASDSIVRQRLLLALLSEAERLYPRLREELVEMAMRYSSDGIHGFFELKPELMRWIIEYCQRWNLIDPEHPEPIFARIADFCGLPQRPPVPIWFLNVMAETLTRTSFGRCWSGWQIAGGATWSENEIRFEPYKESLAAAKRRYPRSKWPLLREAIDAALEAGAVQPRTRWNPATIEWSVRAQIGGESWRQIAERILGPATPKHLIDEQADALRKQCAELLRIAGLSKPRGRRAK
jgi:hypothetical protein